MLDFACRCLCRHFCEGSRRDFERSRDLALTIIKGLCRIEAQQVKTICICQLLICVAEGKSLDSRFGSEQTSSPLENALSAWTSLQKIESIQEKLREEIKHLIQIQAVAVHMEKGSFKEAEEVLERLFPESTSNEPLRMKLAAITRQKDPYHQFLQHFSFSLLTEKIKSYIRMFLNEKSDNFLMKEATKEAKTKKSEKITTDVQCNSESEAAAVKLLESMQRSAGMTTKSHVQPLENSYQPVPLSSEPANQESEEKGNRWWKQTVKLLDRARVHKQSCSLTGQAFWKLGQIQCPHRTKITKQKTLQSKKVLKSIENIRGGDSCLPAGQKKQRWSWEEDQKLKEGVQKFGVGNWTQILQHYDFNNRTNVMLKDRWRTMVRLSIV